MAIIDTYSGQQKSLNSNNTNDKCLHLVVIIVKLGEEVLIFSANYNCRAICKLERVPVLILSHLQGQHFIMCHPRVSNSLCTQVVHPKNLENQHVYATIGGTQNTTLAECRKSPPLCRRGRLSTTIQFATNRKASSPSCLWDLQYDLWDLEESHRHNNASGD